MNAEIFNNKVKINNQIINEELFGGEKVDYNLRYRTEEIDNLITWIAETKKENDKFLMIEDLRYLISLPDEFIFSNLNTNEYIAKSDNEKRFNEICEEILKENKKQ